MPHPLDSFFAPASIALIGASRDHEKIPGRLLSMLRKNEYSGQIYPVNPNYVEIDGLTCYKSNADIISSGFAEEGGDSAAMQEAIADLARRTGMRISGPNAEGFLSQAQRVA